MIGWLHECINVQLYTDVPHMVSAERMNVHSAQIIIHFISHAVRIYVQYEFYNGIPIILQYYNIQAEVVTSYLYKYMQVDLAVSTGLCLVSHNINIICLPSRLLS